MGAGKTSIGKQLAKVLNLTFYDSDREIEKRAGADIPWIFELEGEEGFRQRETKVIAELTQLKGIVLATGGGVVMRPENREALSQHGIVIYLYSNIEDLLERTSRTSNRPLLTKQDPRTVFENLLAVREPLYREMADLICDTSSGTVPEITQQIIKDLQQKGLL